MIESAAMPRRQGLESRTASAASDDAAKWLAVHAERIGAEG